MIGLILKNVLAGDTTNNSDAATLAADFPSFIPSAGACPKYLFTCLKNLVFSSMDTPLDNTFANYISQISGDQDIGATGIYINETVYASAGDTPSQRGSHLDENGARFSIVGITTRIQPPESDTEATNDFVTQMLVEQIDLRIQWLIDKDARESRKMKNPSANVGLSPYLSPAGDPNLNSNFATYAYYLQTKQKHALEMTSFYQMEYVTLFL